MTGSALSLVLTAAVLHAVWNLAAKRVEGDGYVFCWWYDLASACLWVPVAGVVLARQGWPLTWALLWGSLVSGVIHIAYQLWLQTGYDKADLGIVYPVARGVGPLLSMLVAVVFLGHIITDIKRNCSHLNLPGRHLEFPFACSLFSINSFS